MTMHLHQICERCYTPGKVIDITPIVHNAQRAGFWLGFAVCALSVIVTHLVAAWLAPAEAACK